MRNHELKRRNDAFKLLKQTREGLTRQQYRTFAGQIKSGDIDGFYRGHAKVLPVKFSQ